MRTVGMAEEIKNWIEETLLSENAKEKLLEEALKIYEKIKDFPYLEEDKAKAALFLACDKYLCAVPRKVPKPKIKILNRAREKTGIGNIEAIERVDSMCKLINRYESGIPETAKKIISKYKENCPIDYYGKTPSGTAIAAIYIASILCDEHIPQGELAKQLGAAIPTIRNRYKDMLEKLDIDILL